MKIDKRKSDFHEAKYTKKVFDNSDSAIKKQKKFFKENLNLRGYLVE